MHVEFRNKLHPTLTGLYFIDASELGWGQKMRAETWFTVQPQHRVVLYTILQLGTLYICQRLYNRPSDLLHPYESLWVSVCLSSLRTLSNNWNAALCRKSRVWKHTSILIAALLEAQFVWCSESLTQASDLSLHIKIFFPEIETSYQRTCRKRFLWPTWIIIWSRVCERVHTECGLVQ